MEGKLPNTNTANEDHPFNPMTYNPRLWEGLPSQTNRYDDANTNLRQKAQASVDRQNDQQRFDVWVSAVNQGWREYCHPVEGCTYFYNEELRIVTEMCIRHDGVLDQLMNWYGVYVILRDQVLPEAVAFDVFLDCSSEGTCRYYLIDHANKTICWLRRRTTADLGVSDVRNVLHLRALLNEEYWTHAEYMPKNENHLASARTELQAALASSMLDNLTSEGSTSPFTTEECDAYLLALDKAAQSGHMVYLNWSIGGQSKVLNF
ncbi:hypothetical protein FRC12_008300 [Ceratobasidium sp. 428]|nr:hypothetical protein FRC12_008300 [Ceratobasidium sp. 428]